MLKKRGTGCPKKTATILKCYYSAVIADGEFIVAANECLCDAIWCVDTMDHQWLPQHRAFVLETFFKSNESFISTQRQFRVHFNVGRHGATPNRKTIHRWVSNFRNTASALKIKPSGRPRTVRTPENVETVCASVLRSPKRSARRQSMALQLSISSVCRT